MLCVEGEIDCLAVERIDGHHSADGKLFRALESRQVQFGMLNKVRLYFDLVLCL